MVCLACLLPLFLIPVVNALPLLFSFLLSRVYKLFGWEYKKPEVVPPACPFKPKNVQDSDEANVVNPHQENIVESVKKSD